MQSFQDTRGRAWVVDIDVYGVGRVRKLVGVDLYGLVDDGLKPLGELLGDPCKLVDVLFVLCRDKQGKPPESDEDFGRAMAGDVLLKAADSFVEALVDFFPTTARESLRKMLRKGREVGNLLTGQAEKEVERFAGLDAAELARQVRTSLERSGKPPESSGSTPDLTPSINSA